MGDRERDFEAERSRSPERRQYDNRDREYDRRSRSPEDRRERHSGGRDRSPRRSNGHYDNERSARPPPRTQEERQAAKGEMMKQVNDSSQQDRRVYVGNLSYDVKWHHLKDHMRKDGTLDVIFADVLLLPNGMSKGCGIVEYQTRDQARIAIETLSNTPLMGRLVYVREDRETEPRFAAPQRGGMEGGYPGGAPRGGFGGRGGFPGGAGGGFGGGMQQQGGRSQIFVSNLPFQVGWQDLKDLFRQAGNVIRADVHMAHDGSPKGSGVVAFETPEDAQNAIQTFHGYDWQGRLLEVREDRYANAGPGGFGGRGNFRAGFGGGFGGRGGFGARGGFGGGYGGGGGGSGGGGGRGGFGGGYGGGGYQGGGGGFAQGAGFGGGAGYNAGPAAAASVVPPNPFTDGVTSGGEANPIIHVKNLPWSTSNDDLIELFVTIGTVDKAEIQYEPNGRSRGTGVVQFASASDAQTAIEKFQGYNYGGRPLGLDFARYPDSGALEVPESSGELQAQMM